MFLYKRYFLLLVTSLFIWGIYCFGAAQNVSITPENAVKKRAIVVGASDGMGKEVAKLLAADGYIVGLAARRLPVLEKIKQDLSTQTYVKQLDASKPDEAVQKLESLIQEMGGLDLLVISISGFRNVNFNDRNWEADKAIYDVDVIGFSALARTGLNFFETQGYGHLVGFSSVDGLHGVASCPAYSAAKAFCSRYLEAERNRCIQKNIPIIITEIVPGWVNSIEGIDYTKKPNSYWVESLPEASKEIFQAIKNKESVAYITKRWQKVAELLKVIPNDLYNALSARPGGGF